MKLISYIVLAALMSFPVASAITINPGGSVAVNCTGIDETIPVTCTSCQGNQTCPPCNETGGTCTIDKELRPGEYYEKQEGVCDVEIAVEDCDESTETVQKSYVFDMHVDKHEGDDIKLSLEVRDFLNTVIGSKMYDFESEDIVTATYRYNFSCPTEVFIDEIDFQGCSKYFDQYFEKAEPLAMVLATGSKECNGQLITCLGNIEAEKSLTRDYKAQWEDCKAQHHAKDVMVQNMNETLKDERVSMTGEITKIQQETVPGVWMTAAIVEFVIILLVIGGFLFGGTEGI